MGRPSVGIVSQLGIETVPGTAVAANRFLPTISFNPKLKRETKDFRAQGSKYVTSSVKHKQASEGSFEGVLDYNSIIYVLNGLTVPVTTPSAIAGSTTGKLWSFRPNSRAQDNPKTFTIEKGDETAADRFAYSQLTSLSIDWGQDDLKISGNMFARTQVPNVSLTAVVNEIKSLTISATGGTFTLTYSGQTTAAIAWNAPANDVYGALVALTNIGSGDVVVTGGPGATAAFAIEFTGALGGATRALTSTTTSLTGGAGTATIAQTQAGGGSGVTEVPERPVERGQIDVFLDSTLGAIGTTQITDAFEEQMQLGEKFKPKFVHNSTYSSFKEGIEVAPSLVFSFMQEHNSQSRTMLASVISTDTIQYMRVRAKGLDLSTAVDGSVTELVQFDLAGKFTEPEEVMDALGQGVYAYRYHFVALADPTMGRPWQSDIQNIRTSL